MSNPNLQLTKERKNLLKSQNIRNIATNIHLIRHISISMKNIISVFRKGIFLAFMIAILLWITTRLDKNLILYLAQLDFKNNLSFITQIVANKIFETRVI